MVQTGWAGESAEIDNDIIEVVSVSSDSDVVRFLLPDSLAPVDVLSDTGCM